MNIYKTIQEAIEDAKARGVKLTITYVVNRRVVHVSAFRQCENPITNIYRSGLELIVEK